MLIDSYRIKSLGSLVIWKAIRWDSTSVLHLRELTLASKSGLELALLVALLMALLMTNGDVGADEGVVLGGALEEGVVDCAFSLTIPFPEAAQLPPARPRWDPYLPPRSNMRRLERLASPRCRIFRRLDDFSGAVRVVSSSRARPPSHLWRQRVVGQKTARCRGRRRQRGRRRVVAVAVVAPPAKDLDQIGRFGGRTSVARVLTSTRRERMGRRRWQRERPRREVTSEGGAERGGGRRTK